MRTGYFFLTPTIIAPVDRTPAARLTLSFLLDLR